MIKKEIFIVRHGQTEFNRLNIVQGSGINMELNNEGIRQAAQFYEAYKNYPFQHVFVSGLIRTYQSVKAFIDNGLAYTVVPELNEISWGDFEGKEQTTEQKTYYWNAVNAWSKGELDVKIPGGESPIELQNRQKIALDIILKSPYETVLVCMHGRAMKSFLCLMLNKPLTEMEMFQHTNLGLYQLTYDNGIFNIVKSNDTTHLNGKAFL